ncbi:hypothetical protein GGX14DRAFT_569432 [Mycena pura]|uniref:C2H2-type domain-containing protein n=1 Tax=Mycena pura TaxID=153505 RepID=A0AAD6Y6L6_9AGAR|nr:hypothetical protein GGX14DRAFT_569432 [Mycena pura]
MRTPHTNSVLLTCPEPSCGQPLINARDCTTHAQVAHGPAREEPAEAQMHERGQEQERGPPPFACLEMFCIFATTTQGALTRHYRERHHMEPPVRLQADGQAAGRKATPARAPARPAPGARVYETRRRAMASASAAPVASESALASVSVSRPEPSAPSSVSRSSSSSNATGPAHSVASPISPELFIAKAYRAAPVSATPSAPVASSSATSGSDLLPSGSRHYPEAMYHPVSRPWEILQPPAPPAPCPPTGPHSAQCVRPAGYTSPRLSPLALPPSESFPEDTTWVSWRDDAAPHADADLAADALAVATGTRALCPRSMRTDMTEWVAVPPDVGMAEKWQLWA